MVGNNFKSTHVYTVDSSLHQSTYTATYRARVAGDGERVLIRVTNDAATPAVLASLRREQKILQLLGVECAEVDAKQAELDAASMLVSADPGGEPLGPLISAGMALPTVLWIAEALVERIHQLHGQRVILKNVNPHNVLVDRAKRSVEFISFDLASLLPREQSQLAHPEGMEGRLEYIAPEQTGRMNRAIDYRTDFYSLGVTLYEMATGQLPFHSADPVELVHAHIAKPAVPAAEAEERVPQALSDIIDKLMAKNAEDRYQSAIGILRDLQRCREMLEGGEEGAAFEVGQNDLFDFFQVPQKLFGRDEEIAGLLAGFDRVAGGATELMLISGYSGIGKSSLVREVHKPIVDKRGFFTSGKHDQYKRNVPYFALTQAFRELTQQLLTASAEEVRYWKQQLQQAVGEYGRLLTDLIPELELLLDEQPALAMQDPADAEGRFTTVFTRFVSAFTDSDRPLVIFLDDLQWADLATLKLIKHLMTSADALRLFVVGAYRDNEVTPTHPLMLAIDELKEAGVVVHDTVLKPMPSDAVEQLVAETLHRSVEETAGLASLLLEKTGGNPFFLLQFFESLHEDGYLRYDTAARQWHWDIDAIRRMESTENVVELMIGKLRKLPERTLGALKLASCIGNTFELSTLALVTGQSPELTAMAVWDAAQRGQVIPPATQDTSNTYRFVHDRVQQAAYSLIEETERKSVHHKIGRQIWREAEATQLEDRVFDICDHLNRCPELLETDDERMQLAALNLLAGTRAKASAAHDTAHALFTAGIGLLGDGGWDEQYELAMQLHRDRSECEYLSGNFEEAGKQFDVILDAAQTELEKVEIYRLKTRLAYHSLKFQESFENAVAGLALLGVQIPDHADADEITKLVTQEGAELEKLLKDRNIAELVDLPEMTDLARLAEADLLHELALLAMFFTPLMVSLATLKLVRLSLLHGNSRASAPAYGTHGMSIANAEGRFEEGYAFGKMALELAHRGTDRTAECQALYWFGAHNSHWRTHLDEALSVLRSGIELGSIDAPVWAGYCAYHASVHLVMSGKQLNEVHDSIEKYRMVMDDNSRAAARAYLQLVRALSGRIEGRGNFDEDDYDEEEFVKNSQAPGLLLALQHYHVAKVMSLVLFGRSREAVSFIDKAAEVGDMAVVLFGQLANAPFIYYSAVALADVISDALNDEEAAKRREQLDSCIDKLAGFAEHCPDNFQHMLLLAQAERTRLDGDQLAAMDLYERAIDAAREGRFAQGEALAAERASRFQLAQGRRTLAETYLRSALRRYAVWGATAKVKALQEELGARLGLQPSASGRFQTLTTLSNIGSDETSISFKQQGGIDLASVLKTSQALTGEIDLERLLEKTLGILLENAGAERGVLLIQRDGDMLIEAEGRIGAQGWDVTPYTSNPKPFDQPDGEDEPKLCNAIVQYALRTRDTVVLDNASKVGLFIQDPYITSQQVRSVICTPLIHQAKLVGAVYLENNLVTGAFTRERIETLKMLSSYAVIAIQNASLYADLNRYSRDLERINGSMSRFIPQEFLACLGKSTLLDVALGQNVHREMSVLFSDIRGFTAMVEKMQPHEHIGFINDYLTHMEPAIIGNDGFVDSYIGDAIMALFGGGVDAAVRAGIDMSAGLRAFNEKRKAAGDAPIRMGVGLNTGSLTLGTIGGPTRIKCGVIGDCVNLAARIEELTKRFDTFMLMSDEARSRLSNPNAYNMRVVGRVQVAGVTRPVTVYEVIDAEPELERRDEKLAMLPTYTKAVELYFQREFSEAGRLFAECVVGSPSDVSARRFQSRCLMHLDDGVTEGWTGVVTLN